MVSRYKRGRQFQEHVTALLDLSGYLEGQIYCTGSPVEGGYYEKLKEAGMMSYTSPDVMIANRWMDDTPAVEFRFGLACSRRDKIFDNFGKKSVTVPTYQRKQLQAMVLNKRLSLYMVFGRRLNEEITLDVASVDESIEETPEELSKGYAMGVAALREPDAVRHYTDHSTGNERWNDIYYLENLATWRDFIQLRINEGDKEPSLDRVDKLEIPWIGEHKN